MNLSEATKITILYNTVNFKSNRHDITALLLERNETTEVIISISDNDVEKNFQQSGVSYDRWLNTDTKGTLSNVKHSDFKYLNDFYIVLPVIKENTPSNIENGIAFEGESLANFVESEHGKLLQQLLDKNFPGGMSKEERKVKNQNVIRPYLSLANWEVTFNGDTVLLKHRNGCTALAEEIDRDYYKVSIRMSEEHFDKVFDAMTEAEFTELMSSAFADLLTVGILDIQFGDIARVGKLVISDSEPMALSFPRKPFLVTNTLGNYAVDDLKLVRITDAMELKALDLSDRDCMGVLLDFSDPKTALAMLDIASGQDTYIYYLQPEDGEMSILSIKNECGRRSRRGRR